VQKQLRAQKPELKMPLHKEALDFSPAETIEGTDHDHPRTHVLLGWVPCHRESSARLRIQSLYMSLLFHCVNCTWRT